jgi:hypothetical protein
MKIIVKNDGTATIRPENKSEVRFLVNHQDRINLLMSQFTEPYTVEALEVISGLIGGAIALGPQNRQPVANFLLKFMDTHISTTRKAFKKIGCKVFESFHNVTEPNPDKRRIRELNLGKYTTLKLDSVTFFFNATGSFMGHYVVEANKFHPKVSAK